VGGLTLERKAAFPRAIVHISRAAADYWQGKSSMAAASVAERQRAAAVAATLKPYSLAGRLKAFDGETVLVPGVRALPDGLGTALGSTVYLIESRGERIVFWGDTLNLAGAAQRNVLLKNAAQHGNWVAAAQRPFPGIGHVHAASQGLVFLPAERTVP
jgi:glyoxylase-like metal-dependent hydrolase (beta-lactamase superfamily II)